jgi:hypothetical protein
MRKIAILAALAAATVASPAFAQDAAAGEGRVEVRGGIAWAEGAEEAFAGVAVGYDFDLGDTAFIGVEGGADKVLAEDTDVFWTIGGRVGAKVGDAGRAYVLGGYGFAEGDDGAFAGAGYQHNLGEKAFAKVEYRRTLVEGSDVNFAGVGVGIRF